MKLSKKLIALNLALILCLSLLPLQALAASISLSLGSVISFEEPNEDGYTFTPTSAGLYTVTVSRTVKYSGSPASCGSLVVYQGTATGGAGVAGIRYINYDWSTYSYTIPMNADETYTIVPRDGDQYSSACNYSLSVSKTNISALSAGVEAKFRVSSKGEGKYFQYDPHYFTFTPSQSGWYTFALDSSAPIGVGYNPPADGRLSLYDSTFISRVSSNAIGWKGEGISSYLQGGQTYYLSFEANEYIDSTGTYSITASRSSFPVITASTSQTVYTQYPFTYVTFTPETSGSYTITAHSSDELRTMEIYDAEGGWLDEVGGDKELESELFATMELAKGSTYYIGVDSSCTISVSYSGETKTAIITDLSPANAATNVGYDASNKPEFKITFDRDIYGKQTLTDAFPDLDFSKGSIKIFRLADDKLIFEAKQTDYINSIYNIEGCFSSYIHMSGNTLEICPLNPHTLLDPGSEYYITVDEGVIRFEDGSVNPAIKKGDWTFSTGRSDYSITVPGVTEYGAVTADRKTASSGDTVTLTVSPEQGWTLETLTATNISGNKIDLNIVKVGEKYSFKMPDSNVTVTATFKENDSSLNRFADVPTGSYYYDAVLWAVKNGVTTGIDASHFSPDGICTRAQAVTFLWRAAGSPAPKSSTMPFIDVPAGSYYYDAVLWAVENGITKGTGDTTFSPDATCTRAQIVTFLWRSRNAPATGSSNPFTDVAAGDYYADAVLWAVKEGVTKGTGDTTFSPGDTCTRAQIVTFLFRAYQG